MNKNELKEIREIAKDVRTWCEKVALKHNFDNDLGGFCGVASGALFLKLKESGFSAQIIESDCHAFVIHNNYLIDVTATQFRKRKICIRKVSGVKENFWKIEIVHNSIKTFILSQKNWPEENRFIKYKKYIKDIVK